MWHQQPPFQKALENVTGTKFTGRLTGTSAANRLSGTNGNGTLTGAGVNDTITGSTGADRMTGGAGNDVFDFDSITDSGPAAVQRDVIVDFNAGTTSSVVDRIDLSTIDAKVNVGGNQAFSFIGGAAFSAAGQGAGGPVGWRHDHSGQQRRRHLSRDGDRDRRSRHPQRRRLLAVGYHHAIRTR